MNPQNAKFFHMDKLHNMMANIIAEGEKEVWQSIEEVKNPFDRCKERSIYFQALAKIKKGK